MKQYPFVGETVYIGHHINRYCLIENYHYDDRHGIHMVVVKYYDRLETGFETVHIRCIPRSWVAI